MCRFVKILSTIFSDKPVFSQVHLLIVIGLSALAEMSKVHGKSWKSKLVETEQVWVHGIHEEAEIRTSKMSKPAAITKAALAAKRNTEETSQKSEISNIYSETSCYQYLTGFCYSRAAILARKVLLNILKIVPCLTQGMQDLCIWPPTGHSRKFGTFAQWNVITYHLKELPSGHNPNGPYHSFLPRKNIKNMNFTLNFWNLTLLQNATFIQRHEWTRVLLFWIIVVFQVDAKRSYCEVKMDETGWAERIFTSHYDVKHYVGISLLCIASGRFWIVMEITPVTLDMQVFLVCHVNLDLLSKSLKQEFDYRKILIILSQNAKYSFKRKPWPFSPTIVSYMNHFSHLRCLEIAWLYANAMRDL